MTLAPVSGASNSPERPALMPPASCRKIGSSMVIPNMVMATTVAHAFAVRKMSLRKSRGGRMGSGARSSCTANADSSATPAITSPTISQDSHGNCDPPHVATSNSAATPSVSSTAPR
jgi:hypothetical protein